MCLFYYVVLHCWIMLLSFILLKFLCLMYVVVEFDLTPILLYFLCYRHNTNYIICIVSYYDKKSWLLLFTPYLHPTRPLTFTKMSMKFRIIKFEYSLDVFGLIIQNMFIYNQQSESFPLQHLWILLFKTTKKQSKKMIKFVK